MLEAEGGNGAALPDAGDGQFVERFLRKHFGLLPCEDISLGIDRVRQRDLAGTQGVPAVTKPASEPS